ncbi:MAG: biotin/lipoyl-binding protein [Nitrospinae bacterium]|nr:biotin/lipoyl-binding protein [Nitrospinota bacterium]
MKTLNKPLAALTAALMLAGCSGGDGANAAKAERKVVKVKVAALTPRDFSQRMTLAGVARAAYEVTIASEAAGRVEKLGFDKGDRVREGQTLVWLDSAMATAELAQAQAERDLAALEYRKRQALAEKNANVSPFELDKARLTLARAEAAVAALAARLDKYTIRFNALPDRTYHGKIVFLSPEVDRRARVFEAEVEIPNEDGAALPELSAKVTFTRKTLPDSILIPQDAVVELPQGHAAFVVEGNVARQRRVRIEDMAGAQALVGEGLAAGDRLVVAGHRELSDGDAVLVVE